MFDCAGKNMRENYRGLAIFSHAHQNTIFINQRENWRESELQNGWGVLDENAHYTTFYFILAFIFLFFHFCPFLFCCFSFQIFFFWVCSSILFLSFYLQVFVLFFLNEMLIYTQFSNNFFLLLFKNLIGVCK